MTRGARNQRVAAVAGDAEIQRLFTKHSRATRAQASLVHGIAGVALAVLAVALGWSRCP